MSNERELPRRDLLLAAGAGLGALGLGAMASSAAASLAQPGRTFHHIGFPTDTKRDKERYLEASKVYITNPADDPFRVEWCRWMPGSPADVRLRTKAHIAYQVADVEQEIAKFDPAQVFAKPFVPFEGVKVAFIDHEGLLVEFLQVTTK